MGKAASVRARSSEVKRKVSKLVRFLPAGYRSPVFAYKSKNVVVLGVNQGESPQQAGAFAKALRIDFPILLDQAQEYGRVYAALGLPTTFVIDPHGLVVSGFDGPLTFERMAAAVRPLIGKN